MNTRSHHALLERTTVVVLLTAVGVACAAVALGACGGGGAGGPSTPTASPTTAAASPSTTPGSPSPSSSATSSSPAAKQLVIAAATGVNANGLSVVSSTGQVKQLLAPSGGPLRSLAWSSDGTRLAYLQARSADDYAARLFCYDATTGKSSQIVFPNEDNEAAVDSFTWVAPTELIVSVDSGGPTYRANGALWLCDVVKGTRKVVKDAGGHVLRGAGVSSSADGTTIAYVSYGAASGGMVSERLRVFDADNLVGVDGGEWQLSGRHRRRRLRLPAHLAGRIARSTPRRRAATPPSAARCGASAGSKMLQRRASSGRRPVPGHRPDASPSAGRPRLEKLPARLDPGLAARRREADGHPGAPHASCPSPRSPGRPRPRRSPTRSRSRAA